MESSASKCNRALPSAIEPICFGAQLRERYTLKSDIYQLSVLIAGPFLPSERTTFGTCEGNEGKRIRHGVVNRHDH